MSEWQPIETAPKDGTTVRAGAMSGARPGLVPYPLPYRFLDGRWTAVVGGEWRPIDPQPTHWMPLPAPPEAR
jgi:hypothetical protein